MQQPIYFAPLDSRDAPRIARLQHARFPRELTEPASYLREILLNTERHLVCNMSFGLFDGRRMVGYVFAWVETHSAFHARDEEVIYLKEIVLMPGYERFLVPMFLQLFEQWLAFAPGTPLEAHAMADALAKWRRLERLFRHYGLMLTCKKEEPAPGRPPYNIMRLDVEGSPEKRRDRAAPLPAVRWPWRDDVTVSVVHDPAQWLSLRPSWDRLLAATADSNVFQSFDYLWEWWKHYGIWKQLRVFVVRRGDSVIGVAPMMLEHFPVFGRVVRKLMFMTAPMEMNRPKLLFGSDSASCLPAFLGWLQAHSSEWDILDIDEQLEGEQVEALRTHFRNVGCLVAESQTLCPYIDVSGSWEAFLKRRSRRMRGNVNRLRRHLQKAGCGIRTVKDPAELAHAFEDYGDIEQRSWKAAKDLDIGSNRSHYYFYKSLIARFGALGQLEMRLLETDGRPVAATFGILRDGVFHSLKIAHDQAYDRLSPGTVLESYELEQLHAQAVSRYEFMGSFLANKLRWTDTVLATTNLHVYQPQPRLRLFFFVFFVFKRRVKALLRKTGQFERVDRFLGRFRNNPFPRY